MSTQNILEIAEEYYPGGTIRFRYSRTRSPDGRTWIKHGHFCEYYANGNLASEGEYSNDLEEGLWCEYHENGALAAKGKYRSGQEHGTWKFYDANGTFEEQTKYS